MYFSFSCVRLIHRGWAAYAQYFTEWSLFEIVLVMNNAPSEIHDTKYEPFFLWKYYPGSIVFHMLTGYFLWEMKTCGLALSRSLSYTHTHTHKHGKEAGVIYDWNACCILSIHGVRSLIPSSSTLTTTLRVFFSIAFLSAQVFFFFAFFFCFSWLTISYRCTWHSSCYPGLPYGVMCGVPQAAVSRFCWWYMNSSSAAACSELLQCVSTGGKQMRLTQGSSAPPGQDADDHPPPAPLHCSTIAAQYQKTMRWGNMVALFLPAGW